MFKQIIKILFCWVLLALCTVSASEEYTYKVNPGDILEISVWNEENLTREVRVLPDGTISFPLAGNFSVLGKSVFMIRTELARHLAAFVADPEVNVAIKSVDGNVVYVIGKVSNPGQFVMYQPMSIMQLLSLAGGLTTYAKANDIIILRRTEKGQEAIEFEYGELEDGNDLDKNHVLKSGDVVVVP
ncbi:sugar transporter [Methyloprofundus sedimenti]|uniref:Sugar transporter n=1 Tax=Methyloprofundus sedimenti TaxID=1420851 RepID=A0A1V8M6K6_9GAMM|nr:polysaccharide biosynthesis/export family protein [Methyloprofundus sedimenti]OQK17023.1 sugar transporter [Methyloprofundus sedimenti]